VNIKNIFVSKRGGIGDVIMSTPILRALKNKYPDSTITLLIFAHTVEAVGGLPYIDNILIYDKKLSTSVKILKRIWHYDLALLLDYSYRPAFLAYLAQIPARVGVNHKRASLLTHGIEEDPLLDEYYEPYNFANILKRGIGLDLVTDDLAKIDISPVSDADRHHVEQLLKSHGLGKKPYIAIAPFTAFAPKDWPLENYRNLIGQIQSKYHLPIVLLGTQQKAAQVADFPAINLFGQTTFMQMAEVIRRAKLLVGSCSGHTHVAAAVNTPAVVLYGPGSAKRWFPQKNAIGVTINLPCSPCQTQDRVCGEQLCMRQMSPELVFDAVEQALSKFCS
jgi:lipopolysaccharide heptosyltransferase II